MSTPNAADVTLPDLSRLLKEEQFRKAAEAGEVSDGTMVAKDLEAEIRQISGKSRQLGFRLTTGSDDRSRDTLAMNGWVTSHFEKNPVWLFGHSTWSANSLIGLVVKLDIKAKAIDVVVEYMPAEINPLAETVLAMHLWRKETKALKDRGGAASVGALPLKWAWNRERGGVDFMKQELLEGSDVILPANRDALMRMKSAGIELGPVGDWAEQYRKAAGIVTLEQAQADGSLLIDQERAEAIVKVLNPACGLELFELPAEKLSGLRVERSGPREPQLDRVVAGLKLLPATIRSAVAPVMAAVGYEGAADLVPSASDLQREAREPEQLKLEVETAAPEKEAPAAGEAAGEAAEEEAAPEEKAAEAEPKTTETAPLPDAEKAAPPVEELDEAAIDRLARQYADRAMIELTGSPLREDN